MELRARVRLVTAQKKILAICKAEAADANILVEGPRCTGLSTMAKELAASLPNVFVLDYQHISHSDGPCERSVVAYNPEATGGRVSFYTPSDGRLDPTLPHVNDIAIHEITALWAHFSVFVEKNKLF
jgi:hypothetical protein